MEESTRRNLYLKEVCYIQFHLRRI